MSKGDLHEEVEMDVGNDSTRRDGPGGHPIPDLNIEGDPPRTEPININHGRRRPSEKSYADHEKV